MSENQGIYLWGTAYVIYVCHDIYIYMFNHSHMFENIPHIPFEAFFFKVSDAPLSKKVPFL